MVDLAMVTLGALVTTCHGSRRMAKAFSPPPQQPNERESCHRTEYPQPELWIYRTDIARPIWKRELPQRHIELPCEWAFSSSFSRAAVSISALSWPCRHTRAVRSAASRPRPTHAHFQSGRCGRQRAQFRALFAVGAPERAAREVGAVWRLPAPSGSV